MCLCNTISELKGTLDEKPIAAIATQLNQQLASVRAILSKSKALSRLVRYTIAPVNQRTSKILSVGSVDAKKRRNIYDRFRDDAAGFWASTDGSVPPELRRRLACMIVFLRSELGVDNCTESWVPAALESAVQGSTLSDFRYAGKKYVKMARKLGGIAAIFWLPFVIPSSTYERYLHMDDTEAFDHLQSLAHPIAEYFDFLQSLISFHFNDVDAPVSKLNLFKDYSDMFPASDRVTLLVAALGGLTVPVDLLTCVRSDQRRWTSDGVVQNISAVDFGIPSEVVDLLASDEHLTRTAELPAIERTILSDGTVVWSIDTDSLSRIRLGLSPQTIDHWSLVALRIICFACPPCYEGLLNWTRDKKQAIWALLKNLTDSTKVPTPQRTQVIDALLFFAERDLFATRQAAVLQAEKFLTKSMDFYYHASLTLFQSIMLRLEGNFDASSTTIRDFLDKNSHAKTPCDNALRGRLHVSWIENKIHQYDKDVALVMYDWEGRQPLSVFESEVTRRLQGTAAKYFHSIGDFVKARESLQQHLSLTSTQPIRNNTRLLITTKLAEIHCELGEHDVAEQLLQPEIDTAVSTAKATRPLRRILMVKTEVDLCRGRFDEAESTLRILAGAEPPELDDLNDQVLHIRRLLLVSRSAHERLHFQEALQHWQTTLQKMNSLSIFSSRHPWTAVAVHLSIAHVQLRLGNLAAATDSWASAVDLSRREKCEYIMPTVATGWVPRIVGEIHGDQGWPFRMMMPNGRPDVTWV